MHGHAAAFQRAFSALTPHSRAMHARVSFLIIAVAIGLLIAPSRQHASLITDKPQNGSSAACFAALSVLH
jgi:hypothetical protein